MNAKDLGGIDFRYDQLDLQIKRDADGVPLPLQMQDVEDIHINGLVPIIIDIKPMTNLPLLLGMAE
jgi:hypothetical protein